MTFSLDIFQIFDKEHLLPKKERIYFSKIRNFKPTMSLISVWKRRVESFSINALH